MNTLNLAHALFICEHYTLKKNPYKYANNANHRSRKYPRPTPFQKDVRLL